MTTHTSTGCPFCHATINAERNPLRFSGAHTLGCASCYGTPPLRVARTVRPSAGPFSLNGGRGA